jgi:phosphatidate phosphatase APP1
MALLHTLRNAAVHMDALSDRARARLARARQARRPLLIEPYAGYGCAAGVTVGGRVLVDPGFTTPDAALGRWRNLAEMARRLESDEVPGARVEITFQGESTAVVADEEGHFRITLVPPQPQQLAGDCEVELRLLEPVPAGGGAVTARAPVHLVSPRARLGVISDIDDTVLRSHVTQRWKMLATLLTHNAHTRMPFAGVGALYRALHAGGSGADANPFFYVSSSPWNLHAMLREFLAVQGLPAGPLLLRDFGEHLLFGGPAHGLHKGARIDEILGAVPHLPFLLIGDSGEQDPEIYAEVARRHPQRVRAIYIRSVHRSPERRASVLELAALLAPLGVRMRVVEDSTAAAVDMAAAGWINPDAVADVRADARLDRAPP